MKKYMTAAIAFLLFAGITNAQVAQKQASKPTIANHSAATKPRSASTTNTVASASPTVKKTTPSSTTIKRKHHHKKAKAATPAGKK
jgi:hypothetical protein